MNTFALLDFNAVMQSVGGVVLAVAVLLVMVTIHEFGHYVAGKLLHFKINEFAVGFGPAILKKRSKKTGELFALRIIPLGGYCAFDGEDEFEEEQPQEGQPPFEEMTPVEELVQKEDEYPEPKGERFNDQKPWKRIIVLIAGATMNYLLALVLLFIMFGCYGRIHSYIGYTGEEPPAITNPDGLCAQDIVLSVDGQDIYLTTDYVDILSGKNKGDEVSVKILRRDADKVWQEKTLNITLQADCHFTSMTQTGLVMQALGLHSEEVGFASVTMKAGFFETIGSAVVYSFKIGGTVLRSLGELVTGRLGLNAMGGPVTTIKVTSQIASAGVLPLLNIAAFIGVNLAVFNLLPIPALDGCKVIFCIIEWIRKKPVNRKVEAIIHFAGIILLFGFAILVDVLQLFA
ncbi:MAG: site-2 protease family protein [Clostridia bacterium]|nr:site-2 protease family protein [Clostridia bacterium]